MTDAIYDYEGLKVLAKDLGRPVETLVAQSPQSDPFYANRDRYKQHQGKSITHSATITRRRRKANGGGAS